MAQDFEAVPLSGTSLAGIGLFEGLPTGDRDAIAGRCHGRRYRADAVIVTHEEDNHDVFLIVSGTVRVTFFSANGKEISFRDMHAGQMFGELAAIDGGRRSAYVVARTETLIAALPAAGFMALLSEHPAVAQATLAHLATLVRRLTDRVIEFSTLGVKNRIHAELLRLAQEIDPDAGSARLAPAPKHADIASRVSTHREAVTRELNDLARAGLLAREGSALVINDLGRLRRLVEEVSGV